MATPTLQKQLGAFYTPSRVAEVLVGWAVRTPKDRVLDPACGDGVFLEAVAARLRLLRGQPNTQVRGVEVDEAVYNQAILPLLRRLSIPKSNVALTDFFELECRPSDIGDAVVGNPPFIRYQSFRGRTREKALLVARKLGVDLSELASSWAPFLLHACEFLVPNGRLAMVVPAEITHASYARPVVQFLASHFTEVNLASFEHRLFPDLSQDALLLFADGYGGQSKQMRLRRFRDISELEVTLGRRQAFGRKVPISRLHGSNGRLRDHFLPKEVKALYDFLSAAADICRLGEVAAVGIGYVTGNNDFFHLAKDDVGRLRIPKALLERSLLRSGIISGIRVTVEDWQKLRDKGDRVYLLSLPRVAKQSLPACVRKYIDEGEARNVHKAFKCSVRDPWYSVPHKDPADAFLTYMSGETSRVVWNAAGLLSTNSLHEVRFQRASQVNAWRTALSFCCSLSQISSEIEGHPMGGGMLKLEPTEAERVLVVRPDKLRVSRTDFDEVDCLVRTGQFAAAMDIADDLVLRQDLGLTWEQIQVLRDGLREIREARRKKIAPS